MMECDEIIEFIDAAEFALKSLRTVWQRKQSVPTLAVAAFAFAQMSHEYDDGSFATQCGQLFHIAVWVEQLRAGIDPRCNLCKQNGKLKTQINEISELQHKLFKVLQ